MMDVLTFAQGFVQVYRRNISLIGLHKYDVSAAFSGNPLKLPYEIRRNTFSAMRR